jgi:hypothetical protein
MYLVVYVYYHILLHNAQALNHYSNEYSLQKLYIIPVLKEKEFYLQWETYFFEDTVLY